MINFVPSYAMLSPEERERVKEAYRVGLNYCIEKHGSRGCQSEIAKQTGFSSQFICNIKQGFSKNFGEKAMQKIAEYFDLNMTDIVELGEKVMAGQISSQKPPVVRSKWFEKGGDA
jgi:transcriptional regulator with XRE-family HTH domain